VVALFPSSKPNNNPINEPDVQLTPGVVAQQSSQVCKAWEGANEVLLTRFAMQGGLPLMRVGLGVTGRTPYYVLNM
jgi:hypothetical protein